MRLRAVTPLSPSRARGRGRIRLGFHVLHFRFGILEVEFFSPSGEVSSAMSGRQALVAALRASTRRPTLQSKQSRSLSSNFAHGGGASRSLLSTEVGSGVRHIRTHTKHKVILTTVSYISCSHFFGGLEFDT